VLRTWISLSLLAVEAHQVMWLRALKLMGGDRNAASEATMMITEKVDAAQDAMLRILQGAGSEKVIRGYRSKVRANKRRLSK
jgi:hypothetical protein